MSATRARAPTTIWFTLTAFQKTRKMPAVSYWTLRVPLIAPLLSPGQRGVALSKLLEGLLPCAERAQPLEKATALCYTALGLFDSTQSNRER